MLGLACQARHITSADLHKQAGTAVEPLGVSTLGIGCSDGQLRLWDTR
jgi:hypothetical protein